MDKIFILHADHEQNASTSTVRLAGSTGANPFASIAAGIAALWGPSHGGANEAVLDMLDEIGSVDNMRTAQSAGMLSSLFRPVVALGIDEARLRRARLVSDLKQLRTKNFTPAERGVDA